MRYTFHISDSTLIFNRRDCSDVSRAGFNKSGIYSITVRGRVIDVYCDLETDGGNWTVRSRRDEVKLVSIFINWMLLRAIRQLRYTT